jgi:hypothetical protein
MLHQSWGILRTELVPGILALWVAQFLRWLTEREIRIGWLLRQGPRLLTLAAIVYLIQLVLMIWRIPRVFEDFHGISHEVWYSVFSASFVITQNLVMRAAPGLMGSHSMSWKLHSIGERNVV